MDDAWEAVRDEPDPVARGRRATELLTVYRQRSVELARIRRAAVEEARDQLGGSYTEVARAFGLTKGRITQIRSSAPPAHRAFFGVGPLKIALTGRRLPSRDGVVIAAEDDAVGTHLAEAATRLSFATERVIIDPGERWEPTGDAVVVCGPASAHVGHVLMDADPVIGMRIVNGTQWCIEDKETGATHPSPMDSETADRADHAYIARHVRGSQAIVTSPECTHWGPSAPRTTSPGTWPTCGRSSPIVPSAWRSPASSTTSPRPGSPC